MIKANIIGLILMLCWLQASAKEGITFVVTDFVDDAYPIAVVPFQWKGKGRLPGDMAKLISDDLARSGQFKPLGTGKMSSKPHSPSDVRFSQWKRQGMDYLVIGSVQPKGVNRYSIRFYLYDVIKGTQLAAYNLPIHQRVFRKAGHRISDIIYEKITGEKGAFDTRIAYVTIEKRNKRRLYRLKIADSDGHNPKTMITKSNSIMSPAWSPKGDKIAYVSFESRRPKIYIQEVATGKRTRLPSFKGINSAPAWSPDGRKLAVVLSQGKNPDIYLYDLRTKKFQRLTRHYGIDTEPTWTPDGRSIIFTSDRGGSPQVYELRLNGGKPKRLSFDGSYNARPRVSPNGQQIVMVHRDRSSQKFQIAVLDRQTRRLSVLTSGLLDESPAFAPNGRMIIYSTAGSRSRNILAAVSVDGLVHQRLAVQRGSVREPAWSPFSRR